MNPGTVTPVDETWSAVRQADPDRSRQRQQATSPGTIEAPDHRPPVPTHHLGTFEDNAELHAPAAHVPPPVAPLAPPPKAIAESLAGELEDFDRVAGELHVERPEPAWSCRLYERLSLVSPQMAEAAVVPPVGASKDGRDVREAVRNGHPCAAAGLEHSGQFAQGSLIVRNVLDHRDRKRRSGRAGR
jgi:hypothetical protein